MASVEEVRAGIQLANQKAAESIAALQQAGQAIEQAQGALINATQGSAVSGEEISVKYALCGCQGGQRSWVCSRRPSQSNRSRARAATPDSTAHNPETNSRFERHQLVIDHRLIGNPSLVDTGASLVFFRDKTLAAQGSIRHLRISRHERQLQMES